MTDTTSTTHDARPILERARASMPGLAEIEAALSGIEAALSRIDRDGRPEWTPVDAVLPDALAGRPIPDDLGERVLAVRKANEATGVHVQALTRLRERLHVHQRDTQVRHADPALGVLSTELHQLLTQARPVLAELGDVDSADAAIKAGRVDEWRQAGDLGARYTQLRAAQLELAEDALNPDNRADRDVALLVTDHGHVRDADRHDDAVGTDIRQPHVDPQLMTTPVAPAVATRPWNTGHGLADLRYACRRDVEPWVPAIAELTGARAEFQARKRDAARAAAGLPADAEGQSMFETTVYRPRSTHNVRPMLPGDDARSAARIRAGAPPATRHNDARSTDA
jgi:hypothetical protein